MSKKSKSRNDNSQPQVGAAADPTAQQTSNSTQNNTNSNKQKK